VIDTESEIDKPTTHKKQIATTGLLSIIALSLLMQLPFPICGIGEHSFFKNS